MLEFEESVPEEITRRPYYLRCFPVRRTQWLLAVPAVLVLAVLVVYLWNLPRTLNAGEVIDQFGTYRYPDGRKLVEITRTEAGNVELTISRLSYRYYIIPTRTSDHLHTFEAERDWFVSVDRYQRLWLFVGSWDRKWGPLRKMPSGGTIPYAQSVLMQGLVFYRPDRLGECSMNASAMGDWRGVPHAFFERIPNKNKTEAVWGGIPPIPVRPPDFTMQQNTMLAQRLVRM